MNKFKSFGLIILLVMTVFLFSGCKDSGPKFCPPPYETHECVDAECSNCPTQPCPDGSARVACPDNVHFYCPDEEGSMEANCPSCPKNKAVYCTDVNCCNCPENRGSEKCGCETDADCNPGYTCKKAPGAALGQCVPCPEGCKSCKEGQCYCDAAGNVPAPNNDPDQCADCSPSKPCPNEAECCNGLCCQVGWVCVGGQCQCDDDADCPAGQKCVNGTCCAGIVVDGQCITPCPPKCAVCKDGLCYCDAAGTKPAKDNNPANCDKECYDNNDCAKGDCCGGSCCSASAPKCLVSTSNCGTSQNCVGGGSSTTYKCVQCLTNNDCSGDTPYCVNNVCVQCKEDANCPGDQVCQNGKCVTPSQTCTARCPNDTRCCEDGFCNEYGMCQECPADSNCIGGCGNASCKCSGGTESTTGYCCPGGGSAPMKDACCGNVTPYKPSTGWASTVEEIQEQGCCKVNGRYRFAKSASGTCASTSCAGDPNKVVGPDGKCVQGDASNGN